MRVAWVLSALMILTVSLLLWSGIALGAAWIRTLVR